MLFCTLLSRELIKLCLIRNKNGIMKLRANLTLIDLSASVMQNETDFPYHYKSYLYLLDFVRLL